MVIPIHDINPLARRPVVTWALIVVNVVVFLLFEPVLSTIGGTQQASVRTVCQQNEFFDRWAAIPRELLDNRQQAQVPNGETGLTADGQAGCVVGPPTYDKSPVLSVLTSMFLHGGWLHLLGNMLFLLIFGNNVEDRMGRLKFLGFYLFCGFAAAYGFAAIEGRSDTTLVGASGAIAGVLGAYLVTFPKARVIGLLSILFFLPFWLPAWVVLGGWFLIQWAYFAGIGLADGSSVAYAAHVVGFVVGAAVTLPFVRALRERGPGPIMPTYGNAFSRARGLPWRHSGGWGGRHGSGR